MSFSFGNTSQTPFGSTPAKTTGFGAPFAGTPSTSTYGGFGTTAAQTSQPFGATTFGATPTAAAAPQSNAPQFGTVFGTPGASTLGGATVGSNTFGSLGNQAVPSTQATGGQNLFGAKPSLFGTPSTVGSTNQTIGTPSLFGTPAATATSTNFLGSNLFGASTPAFSAGGGGTAFGGTTPATTTMTTTTTAPSLFGTVGGFGGAATTTTASSLFGGGSLGTGGLFGGSGGAATTSAPLFSGFGGTTTTTSAPGTGFGFGSYGTGNTLGGTSTTAFGGGTGTSFGTGTASVFGVSNTFDTKQQSAVSCVDDKAQQILASFYAINLFGDERDAIIKKWNMLQACWGTGKGYYSTVHQPVEYDHGNPFFRFKSIGYVVVPETDNSDGFVKLLFHKKEAELSSSKESLVSGLLAILGNKPNLSVKIEHVKAISDEDSEVMITVSEKGVTGTSRKIQSSDLTAFLQQQKQQLASVGVFYVGSYVAPTKAQVQEYLKNPPPGIDAHSWCAAQIDNPMPNKYLPTPMNGFTDLKKRMMMEEYETGIHRAYVDKVNDEIKDMKRKHAASIARIAEQKQKFLQLQHRVLRLMVKQEVTRKIGLALQPEEEILRSRLELLYSHLTVPTQFRGLLNELLCTVKMINVPEAMKNENYKMDPKAQDDIKQFLMMEQQGIQHLIDVINKDLRDLKIINDGLSKVIPKK